jgi:hypothetical protein
MWHFILRSSSDLGAMERPCSKLFLIIPQNIGTETIVFMLLRNIHLPQSVLSDVPEAHACAEIWL